MNAHIRKDSLNIAITMRAEGRYTEALQHMESVRPYFLDDALNLRRLLNGMGQTYYALCEYEKAVEHYMQALDVPLADSIEEAEHAAIESNLADALIALGRTDEAHAFLSKAEKTLRIYSNAWLASVLENRARAFLKDKQYEQAINAAKESLDLCVAGHRVGIVDTPTLQQSRKTYSICVELCGAATEVHTK